MSKKLRHNPLNQAILETCFVNGYTFFTFMDAIEEYLENGSANLDNAISFYKIKNLISIYISLEYEGAKTCFDDNEEIIKWILRYEIFDIANTSDDLKHVKAELLRHKALLEKSLLTLSNHNQSKSSRLKL